MVNNFLFMLQSATKNLFRLLDMLANSTPSIFIPDGNVSALLAANINTKPIRVFVPLRVGFCSTSDRTVNTAPVSLPVNDVALSKKLSAAKLAYKRDFVSIVPDSAIETARGVITDAFSTINTLFVLGISMYLSAARGTHTAVLSISNRLDSTNFTQSFHNSSLKGACPQQVRFTV
jgi:hypothetical protein